MSRVEQSIRMTGSGVDERVHADARASMRRRVTARTRAELLLTDLFGVANVIAVSTRRRAFLRHTCARSRADSQARLQHALTTPPTRARAMQTPRDEHAQCRARVTSTR